MKKIILLLFFLPVLPVFSQEVLASTAWTRAYVEAAGVKQVRSLAPDDMVHPPEYELTPGDLQDLMRADFIVYAGYEGMVKQLKKALSLPDEKIIQLRTGYTWPVISASVNAVAKAAGTQEEAQAELKAIKAQLDSYRRQIAKGSQGQIPVLVHFHQQGIAKEMGLNVVGIYGPAPLTPSQIKELADTGAKLIIDNAHSPQHQPLKELLPEAQVVKFINFPGIGGTKTLRDVIQFNLKQLL